MKKLFVFAMFAVVLILASCSNDEVTTSTNTSSENTTEPSQSSHDDFGAYDDGKQWGSVLF